MGKQDYAIVIGINDYIPPEEGGLRKLNGAVRDAETMENWLLSPSGGDVDRENCIKCISCETELTPLKEKIDDALEKVIKKVTRNGGTADRFYFYFAGHGFGVKDLESNTALCLANWSQVRRRSALSALEYRDVIVRFRIFKEVIFVADCCRNSGLAIKPIPSDLEPVLEGPFDTRYFVAFSTQFLDQAQEISFGPDAEYRGLFTQALIEGLNGAGSKNGSVNSYSLKNYLERRTPLLAQEYGFKQEPQILDTSKKDEPMWFRAVDKEFLASCVITCKERDGRVIVLLNGNADEIAVLDTAVEGELTIVLERGLYMLICGQVEKSFWISDQKEYHVDF